MTLPKVCVYCGLFAELLCSRCQDPYCSRRCQQCDWSKHRQICFQIPPLVRDVGALGDQFSAVNLSSEKAKKDDAIAQRNAKSPEEIGEKKKIKLTENEIVSVKRTEVDDAVEGKHEEPAKIIAEQEEQFRTPPAQKPTVQVVLKQVEPKAKPSDPVTPWDVPVKKQIPLKLPPSIIGRTMRLPAKPEVIKKVEEPPVPLMMKHLKVRAWPDSKNIRTKILGLTEYNLMTLREDKDEVEEYFEYITSELAKACEKLDKTDYKPVVGEVVFAKYEDEWYRAQVVTITKEKAVVKYIEYGNFDELEPGLMFPATGAKFEVCSRDFFVDNITENLSPKQMEIIVSGDLTITDVRKEADGAYHCKIFGF